MALVYFDSNICVGKRGLKDHREIWKSEDILASMSRAGISGGLVYSGWARDYAPDYGNDRLLEELKKSKRFYGCCVVTPGFNGAARLPQETVDYIRETGMVAAIMFPNSQCFSPDEVIMGEYYTALEDAGILLLVDCAEITWPQLREILDNHPRLNLLLLGAQWPYSHNVFGYLRKYKNLHIDLCCMQSNYAIEKLVEEFGADRIIFGSGLPKMSPGAARAFIDYAEISYEDKKKIAGGNLARLCGVELPEAVEVDGDFIAKEASEGKPMSVYTFDSHAHWLEDGGNCGVGRAMYRGDMENMLHLADIMGVEDHCVAPWPGIWTDSEAGNEIVAEMWERSERVYPYVLIDPNYVTDVAAVVKKYHAEMKMPGIKMFRGRIGRRYNDPVFDPWWEFANENHLFGLMDSGYYPEYLADMEELAQKYPNVAIFLDHGGSNFPRAEAFAALAKKYPNVYIQLTYTSVTEGVIEYMCSLGLADKVMYGTDAPMRDPRPQLGWVAYANISVEDKKKILGENMRRVADKCYKK